MSRSRSATPTNTNPLPLLRSSTPRPTSRQQRHEIPSPTHPLPVGEHEEPFSTLRPTFIPRPTPQTTNTSRRTPPTPPTEMAKRLRRASPPPAVKPETRSSPSTDSQDGMADVEDSARSQAEHSDPPPPPPPKKKRTRTLTTPHQSAVLHALLAQSRFPTTAMREEVGRSIGLSARKVQIWFQNQRQKARRPRTTENPSTSRTAQYTQYSQSTEPHGSFAASGLPLQPRPTTHHGHFYDDTRSRGMTGYPSDSSYHSAGPVESPSRLLGPGMPGSESRAVPILFTRRVTPPESPIAGPSSRPMTSPSHTDPHPARHSSTPPRQFRWSRPMSSHTVMDARERASRTLPPLIFPPPSSIAQPDMMPPRSAPASTLPFLRAHSPSPPFETFAHGVTRSGAALPRPFTLQPPPQWDNSRFTSVTSPSSWSRTSSIHEGSLSPTSPLTHSVTEEVDQDQIFIESSRAGRYDPVRASAGQTSSSTPRPSPPRTNREQRRPNYD